MKIPGDQPDEFAPEDTYIVFLPRPGVVVAVLTMSAI